MAISFDTFVKELPNFDTLVQNLEEMKKTNDNEAFTFQSKKKWKAVNFNDGGGNEGNLILFPDTREAVLFGYDNESKYNFYPDGFESQTIFDSLPEHLYKVLSTTGDVIWNWDEPGKVWATCAYWLTSKNVWEASPTWAPNVEWSYDDGGSNYCLKRVLYGVKENG